MIKFRDAQYCNLKLLLIYLVIYGHLIEPGIHHSPALMAQYRWIYLFHMPLFAFLSGLFLHDCKTCQAQIQKLLPAYTLFQTAAVLFGATTPLIPFWHLWYLCSCCIWCSFAWFWFRFCKDRGKLLILFSSILFGCAAGFIPFIGRTLSLSRTLVFFPYFWMGLHCRPEFRWQKPRLLGLAALGVVIVWMQIFDGRISVSFLYHAAPYGTMDHGFFLRLLCYLLGTLLGLFLLSCTPARRFPFTKAGADTMPAYLFHAPIVLCLQKLGIPWEFYPLITVTYLYSICKLTQWHGRLYGIVPPERRDRLWPNSKQSTKHTPSRSIDSCSP